jgi:hypothetical protein
VRIDLFHPRFSFACGFHVKMTAPQLAAGRFIDETPFEGEDVVLILLK